MKTLLDAASRHHFIGCSYSSLSAAFCQHSLGFNFRYFDVSDVFSTVIQTCASLGYTDLSIGSLGSGEHCWRLASPGWDLALISIETALMCPPTGSSAGCIKIQLCKPCQSFM